MEARADGGSRRRRPRISKSSERPNGPWSFRRPPTAGAPAPLRYGIWAIAVIIVIAIGLQLSGGFPESLTVDVAAKFNAFNDWVIANQKHESALRQHPGSPAERDPVGLRPADPGPRAHDLARADRAARRRSPAWWPAGVSRCWRRAASLFMGVLGLWDPEHRDAGADPVRRDHRAADRHPARDLGGQASLGRTGDPSGAGRDADDPGVLVPAAARAAVRHRRADGAHRHGDLRAPARDPAHRPRHASGARDVARGRTLVRVHVAADSCAGCSYRSRSRRSCSGSTRRS